MYTHILSNNSAEHLLVSLRCGGLKEFWLKPSICRVLGNPQQVFIK